MALVMYQKTHKGMEEAKERKHRLAARTHTALMLVVGAKPAPLLAEQWRAIGAPPDVEEVLVRGGFIELAQLGTANADTHTEPAKAAAPATPSPTPGPVSASDAQRFLEAELFMEQTVMSTSGLRSYFFQLKLQKCSNLEDLRAMLPYYEQVISKGGGEPQARVLAGEAKRLLGA